MLKFFFLLIFCLLLCVKCGNVAWFVVGSEYIFIAADVAAFAWLLVVATLG